MTLTRTLTAATVSMLLLFPSEAARGEAGGSSAGVLEIVSYRLKPGIETSEYLKAAQVTETFLRETGAVVRRYLTVDESGVWTDVIEWTSLEAARAAEAAAMERVDFMPFFEAADPETVQLRHADIRWRMMPDLSE